MTICLSTDPEDSNLRYADPILESWWNEFGDEWWREFGRAMEDAHRARGQARSRPRPDIKIGDCRAIVGQRFGVEKDEMLSDTHVRKVARPRQMAMKLARELTDRSSKDVALHFHRDHTTVLFAEQQVHDREQDSPRIAMQMEDFRLALLTYAAQRKVVLAESDFV